jgi:glucans biosynthesis protein
MQTQSRLSALFTRADSHGRRALAILGLLLLGTHGAAASAFSFDDVAARAKVQAQAPYRSVSHKPPAELQALTYDQYRDIRFRPDHALWRAEHLPFELMFFHLGKFQTEAVRINEITSQGVRYLPYDSADFNYGKNKLSPKTWGDLGYAGFRAHYALNSTAYKDEVVVFLGASYFRALGAGLHYGLSARGPGD